jgi:hypothetical protein
MSETEITEVRHERVQVVHEPRPAIKDAERVDLHGEPETDHAFKTPAGNVLRLRMLRTAEVAPVTPTNGVPSLAPAEITISLSLALLDGDGKVAVDPWGRLLVSAAHEMVIAPGRMVAGVSLAESLDLEVRKLAFAFERELEQRAELTMVFDTFKPSEKE